MDASGENVRRVTFEGELQYVSRVVAAGRQDRLHRTAGSTSRSVLVNPTARHEDSDEQQRASHEEPVVVSGRTVPLVQLPAERTSSDQHPCRPSRESPPSGHVGKGNEHHARPGPQAALDGTVLITFKEVRRCRKRFKRSWWFRFRVPVRPRVRRRSQRRRGGHGPRRGSGQSFPRRWRGEAGPGDIPEVRRGIGRPSRTSTSGLRQVGHHGRLEGDAEDERRLAEEQRREEDPGRGALR